MLEEILETYCEEEFLKADGLDDAVIGIDSASMLLIYSVRKCLDIFVSQGMTEEEAREYFDYNVSGAYVSEKNPNMV